MKSLGVVVAACISLVAVACSRGRSSPIEATAMASAVTPATSATPSGDAATNAAKGKAFGEHCVGDAECAGGVCFHKRLKGPDAGHERRGGDDAVEHDGYCSMKCGDDADCPVPPTRGKCGARGMCKRAE